MQVQATHDCCRSGCFKRFWPFFFEILEFWGVGDESKRERRALLAPGGVELQRPRREHWIVGSWCFLRLTDSWSAVQGKFWHRRYLSVFIGCRKQALCGYFTTRLTLSIAIQLQHPAKPLGFETYQLVCAAKRADERGRRSELRDEFERALHAGSVMEKTLLEPSQVESHQPHLGSAVGLRHGESRTLSELFLVAMLLGGRRRQLFEAFVTQIKVFGRTCRDRDVLRRPAWHFQQTAVSPPAGQRRGPSRGDLQLNKAVCLHAVVEERMEIEEVKGGCIFRLKK